MTARFLSDTPLAGTEIEMQQIPGFRPRKSGVSVSRFSYTPSDCNCKNCTYHAGEKRCGSSNGCICLHERLVAGCVPFSELLEALVGVLPEHPFVARVSHLQQYGQRFFHDNTHRTQFDTASQGDLLGTPAKTAAIFLLSGDAFLWSRAQEAITPDRISFPDIHIRGVDLAGYVLFHTAKDLYYGTKHISLSELSDPELVEDEVFQMIIAAFLIKRYGAEVLCMERSKK